MARQPGHAQTVGAGGGHWYMGEPVPGGCITNALRIDDGLGTPWSPDVQHVRDALQGWLAEQAKEGGVAPVELPMEEEDEEETRGGGPPQLAGWRLCRCLSQ